MATPTVHHVATTVADDGSIVLRNTPFRPGDAVEITIRSQPAPHKSEYPLRGTAYKYIRPHDSVAEEDWEVVQ